MLVGLGLCFDERCEWQLVVYGTRRGSRVRRGPGVLGIGGRGLRGGIACSRCAAQPET